MPTLLDYAMTFSFGPVYIFWRYPLVPLESIPDCRAEIAAIQKDIDRVNDEMNAMIARHMADIDRRISLLQNMEILD